MKKRMSPLSKLAKLTFALALLLQIVAGAREAAAKNPCPISACNYTYDPVEHCCISDPRFDCFDFCF
jgi:hypothetical protein